jgi:hypothetical protein
MRIAAATRSIWLAGPIRRGRRNAFLNRDYAPGHSTLTGLVGALSNPQPSRESDNLAPFAIHRHAGPDAEKATHTRHDYQ